MNEGQTGQIGRDGIGEAIGLVHDEICDELARAHCPVGPAVRQPFGIVHGGAFCAIAESMTSIATAQAVWRDGSAAMGQSNAATFMRPISAGTIHAEARRRHRGRTTWIWDVDFTDDEGRLCATVRMTIAIRPLPADAPQPPSGGLEGFLGDTGGDRDGEAGQAS